MTPVVWIVIGTLAFTMTLFALMARPANIRIRVAGNQLIVEPVGLDRIWCVRAQVAIAVDRVAKIEVMERKSVPPPGIRLPGAFLPGVITAGSYGLGARRSFWDVRRATRLLVITCQPGEPYHQLVLEVASPETTCSQLQAQMSCPK